MMKLIKHKHLTRNIIRFEISLRDDITTIYAYYIDDPKYHIIQFATGIKCGHKCKMCQYASENDSNLMLTATEIFAEIQLVLENVSRIKNRSLAPNERIDLQNGTRIWNGKPILFSTGGSGDPFLNITSLKNAFEIITPIYKYAELEIVTMGAPTELFFSTLSFFEKKGINVHLTISLHSVLEKTREKLGMTTSYFNTDELLRDIVIWKKNHDNPLTFLIGLFDKINDSSEETLAIVDFLEKSNIKKSSTIKIIDNMWNEDNMFIEASNISITGKVFNTLKDLNCNVKLNNYYATIYKSI